MSDLSYPEVGATREGSLPPGYTHTTRHARLGAADLFATARAALARWEPQRGAGLRVRSDVDRVAMGAHFDSGLGIGPLRLWAPCEIVWVVDEPTRYGFGFGTRPGHPEVGEEGLEVSVADGATWFDLRAFSRPGPWWMKPGHPIARRVQRVITDRYVRSMHRAVS
jgi:uncharacterized protein (UPF0548 family)